MLEPHGGSLNESYLTATAVEDYQEKLPQMKRIILDEIEASDLELLANGAFSPLTGFVKQKDYRAILESNHLDYGQVWSLPITLSIPSELVSNYREGDIVALVSLAEQLLGIFELEEIYYRDREREALQVFGTLDKQHPGVNYLMRKGEILLGGRIRAVKGGTEKIFPRYNLTPRETRAEFTKRGWQTIVAFQTRNPIHRAHEYLQKAALEMVDGLFLHPLVGFTKPGDIPAEVRLRCYEVLLQSYYPADRVLLAVYPAAMRYAGPREAVCHALVRKNYGCTHFIVGRDHAGVGNYYGTYDAQKIFDQFTLEELGITILKFENTFYCKKCVHLASAKTCPHQVEDQIYLSGTKVRELLQSGLALPVEFSRPEVSQVLQEYYQSS